MHAYVFTDQALMRQAGQFAWLSIDFDNPVNAPFLERYKVEGVPNFLLIDPKTEQSVMSWYGTVTVAQLQQMLEEKRAAAEKQSVGAPEKAMALADRLNAESKYGEAAAAYRQALDAGGPQWPNFARAAESLMLTYELAGDAAGGVKAAMDYVPKMPRGQSFVNAMRIAILCASREKVPSAADHRRRIRSLAEEALKVPEGLADDKAGIYLTLVSMARDSQDAAEAEKWAREAWGFLQKQTQTAPSAEARASLDWARVTIAVQLKDPALAIPYLQTSERELPEDFNPPVRLATLYAQLNRLDDALAAYQRALQKKVLGARRVSIMLSSVAVYEKKGDKAAARNALEQALKAAEALPEKQAARLVPKIKGQLASYAAPEARK